MIHRPIKRALRMRTILSWAFIALGIFLIVAVFWTRSKSQPLLIDARLVNAQQEVSHWSTFL